MPLPAEERAPRSAVIHVSDMVRRGAVYRCMCTVPSKSGALETLRLASAPRCREVNRDGKSRLSCSGLPPYSPAASTLPVQLLCVATRSTTALRVRPAPTAPVPLSSRSAASLYPRTPRTRPGPGGLARRQRSRSCTTSAKQLLLRSTPQDRTRSPSAGASALARTLPRRPRRCPREPQRPHSEHCTPLAQDVQRHAHHTCAALACAPHHTPT